MARLTILLLKRALGGIIYGKLLYHCNSINIGGQTRDEATGGTGRKNERALNLVPCEPIFLRYRVGNSMLEINDYKKQPVLLERKYLFPFLLIATLFFSWALAAQMNDILVRQFQKALDLSRTQAGFIQTAFYFGYFFGAIPAGLAMKRFGYKNGILFGLALYCGGALMFYPAAEVRVFGFFLAALYTIAFGLAFLETARKSLRFGHGRPAHGSVKTEHCSVLLRHRRVRRSVLGQHVYFSRESNIRPTSWPHYFRVNWKRGGQQSQERCNSRIFGWLVVLQGSRS